MVCLKHAVLLMFWQPIPAMDSLWFNSVGHHSEMLQISFPCLLKLTPSTYHIMMATSLMMASLRQSKKSFSGSPCSFMLPMMRPKHIENTTRPKALMLFTVPRIGITSSRVISWVPLVRLKMVSFTVTFTCTTRFPYVVLNCVAETVRMNTDCIMITVSSSWGVASGNTEQIFALVYMSAW